MDDFRDDVNRRFDKVDGEIRDLRSEMKSGLDGLYRTQFVVGGGTLTKVTEAFELLAHCEWLEWTRLEDDERFYRGTGPPVVADEVFEKLPGSTKALVVSRIFEALAAQTKEAMKAGTICARPDAHFTWTPLELDQQGWEALTALLESVLLALPEEQERARARMAQSGEEPIPMTVGLLGFESPKDPERKFSQ